jgi:hypothetical protein
MDLIKKNIRISMAPEIKSFNSPIIIKNQRYWLKCKYCNHESINDLEEVKKLENILPLYVYDSKGQTIGSNYDCPNCHIDYWHLGNIMIDKIEKNKKNLLFHNYPDQLLRKY